MRTIAEIDAELESMKTRDLECMELELDKCNECMKQKMETGEPYEQWLCKQFQGHLQVVYEFSKLTPIPVDATRNALDGNCNLAVIIGKLGWDNASSFKAVTDDMLQHFDEVVKLKTEIADMETAMVKSVSAVSQTNTTIH